MKNLILSKEESVKLSKKLEYNFKKKNSDFVKKLSEAKGNVELSETEAKLAYSKLEFRFKSSEDELLTKLKESING